MVLTVYLSLIIILQRCVKGSFQNGIIVQPTMEKTMQESKAMWQKRIDDHEVHRLVNPFSEFWGEGDREDYRERLRTHGGTTQLNMLKKADTKYGNPVEGSKTEKRGYRAKDFITNNIVDCCDLIKSLGQEHADGTYTITFGEIFKAYERINDKVVGLLVRARKHGFVEFPGEMLYQRQDEEVIIRMVKVPKFEDINLTYVTFDKGQEQMPYQERKTQN